MKKHFIKLKRVYKVTEESDGFRVLVDRLWPRGILKRKAKINLWLKDIAPSNELRKWFGHKIAKWNEFQKRYREELEAKEEVDRLREIIKKEKVATLLFSASDEKHNNAVALRKILNL